MKSYLLREMPAFGNMFYSWLQKKNTNKQNYPKRPKLPPFVSELSFLPLEKIQ